MFVYKPCLAHPAWKEILGTQTKEQVHAPALCGVQPKNKAAVAACGLPCLAAVQGGAPAQAVHLGKNRVSGTHHSL